MSANNNKTIINVSYIFNNAADNSVYFLMNSFYLFQVENIEFEFDKIHQVFPVE